MRHVRRFLMPALGLALAGCALLPHVGLAPARLSGPITLRITNLPTSDRQIQTSTANTSNLPTASTTKQIELKVFVGSAPNSLVSSGGTIETSGSGLAIATISAPLTGAAIVNIPALPSGDHIIQVNVYKSNATMYDPSSGVALPQARFYQVAQGEAYINSIIGVSTSTSMRLYQTLVAASNLDAQDPNNATTSVLVKGVSAAPPGMYLRLANWNPYYLLFSGDPSYTGKVRIAIVAPTAYSWTVASTSANAGYWMVGDVNSTTGFASHSFAVPPEAGTADIWNWGNASRTAVYTDVDLKALNANYQNLYTVVGDPYGGSLSLVLPTTLCPTNYSLYISDRSADTSLAGTATLK